MTAHHGTEDAASPEDPRNSSGLCLLSLDGGGVRGLSTLRVLKRLMGSINDERTAAGLPRAKPCELFDLMGGTSTGGIIAIMLGRLEMDVDQCIEAYSTMMGQIFGKKSVSIDWRGRIKGRYDTQKLAESIELTMTSLGFPKSELLNDSKERRCRVFVCATKFETGSIHRLKSYHIREDPDYSGATLLEAARATSAATSFFEPASIGKQKYADGALGANNPVHEVWNEAQNIWCHDDGALEPLVSCFVSIGTGNPGIQPLSDSAWKMLSERIVKIATQTERTAQTFEAEHRGLSNQKRYFRFNVEQGLQAVRLDEYQQEGMINAATDDYLTLISQKVRLQSCVERLMRKNAKSPLDLARIVQSHNDALQKARQPPSTKKTFCDIGFIQNVHFVGRELELSAIEMHLQEAKKNKKQGRVCLWGPGGVGKTQLALAYAIRAKDDHSAIFKISARTLESIQQDFADIMLSIFPQADNDPFRKQSAKDSGPEEKHMIMRKAILTVHQWFADRMNNDWLLIIDDVDPRVNIQEFIPRTDWGSVIITGQSRALGGLGLLIELGQLSPEDAVTLLLDKANIHDNDRRAEMQPRAAEIVKLLGYLALAVEHAGALIGCKGIEYYWESYRSYRVRVLELPDPTSIHQTSVFKTFQLSFEVVMERKVNAARLLILLSHLDNSTISEQLLFQDNRPVKPVADWGLFEDRLGFLDLVTELQSLALIYCYSEEGPMQLSLHPLVHYMTRARLKVVNRWRWTEKMARFLLCPFQGQPPQETTYSGFKHLLIVLQQATEFTTAEPIGRDKSRQLWCILTFLITQYQVYWHTLGKMQECERFCRRAVEIMEDATEDIHVQQWAVAVALLCESVQYTDGKETSEMIIRRFVSKQLRPAAAMALQRVTQMRNTKLIQHNIGFYPLSLGQVFRRTTPQGFLVLLLCVVRRLAFRYVGSERWPEALVLASWVDLRPSLWARRMDPFALSTSQVVHAAFDVASGHNPGRFLCLMKDFAAPGTVTGAEFESSVTYDSCRILIKQDLYQEVEARTRKMLQTYSGTSFARVASQHGMFYVWANKMLVLALLGQGQTIAAQNALVGAYQAVKEASGDDNLSMLHIELLMMRAPSRWGMRLPHEESIYSRNLTQRFKRMYGRDRTHVLNSEGLAMGRILLTQGALDEAAEVFNLFLGLSTEMLGADHCLTVRARRLLSIALSEQEIAAEYDKKGDLWLRFGSVTFPRDLADLEGDRPPEGAEKATATATWWDGPTYSKQTATDIFQILLWGLPPAIRAWIPGLGVMLIFLVLRPHLK